MFMPLAPDLMPTRTSMEAACTAGYEKTNTMQRTNRKIILLFPVSSVQSSPMLQESL